MLTYPRGGREIVSRKEKIVDPAKFQKNAQRAVLCRGKDFFSKFLEGGSSLSGTFLGEIIDFSRRMAESAIFNWGIC